MRLPRNAAAFSVSGQVTDMKYINDKPIDFTNDDWKQYTPRERARLEQQEQKKENRRFGRNGRCRSVSLQRCFRRWWLF